MNFDRYLRPATAFGSLYARHAEALTGSTEDADDPDRVAKACYIAAAIYAGLVVFCGSQVSPKAVRMYTARVDGSAGHGA
jgi:hypothetical protein